MKAIGIDLGTTNSVAAYFDGTRAKVLKTRMNVALTPSVVSYRTPTRNEDGQGQTLVGQQAVNNAVLAPQNTVYSIKRLMGRIYDDPKVQELKDKVGYRIVPPSNEEGTQGVRVLINDTPYSPVDISAMILKEIKDYATRWLGEAPSHAVITVPAYFEERQRAATREAAQQAGFVVKMIMSEPVAAALAFGLDTATEEGRRVLVFDLGGGTFDISIIQMAGNQFQVLYHGGDNWLGGDDFDREIIDAIAQHVKEKEGFDPSRDTEFHALAKPKAQEAKIALGASDEYEIIINPAGTAPDGRRFSVQMTITRKEFEKKIMKYVDKCIELTREALRHEELTQEDIADVLLVGGSTSVPLIQQRLQQVFQNTTIRADIDPMECVALGASILAAKLKGVECPQCFEDEEKKQHTINDESAFTCKKCNASLASAQSHSEIGYYDKTAVHLGIRAVKGDNLDAFVPIIPKGTPFPLQEPMCQIFYTTEANQQVIKVPVFEGTHELAGQNDQQGIIEWKLPEELPINTPVEVAFNYDRNRITTVTIRVMGRDNLAHEVVLKRDQPQEIITTTDLGEEVDWREEADIIPAAEQFLQGFETYMKEGAAEKMRRDIEKLREALDENNEVRGRTVAREIYLMMMGGAGVASQLYLAQRAIEGAHPDVAADIQQAGQQLRNACDAGAKPDELGPLVGKLQMKVHRQLQARMREQVVGDKVDYGKLLRFNQ